MFGFAIRNNSPYYQFISKEITKMVNEGHVRFAELRTLKQIPKCKPILREAKPLTFKKLFTVFLIVAGGILAAVTVLVLETMFKPMEKPTEFEVSDDVLQLFDQMQDFFFSNPHNRKVFAGSINDLRRKLKYYKS